MLFWVLIESQVQTLEYCGSKMMVVEQLILQLFASSKMHQLHELVNLVVLHLEQVIHLSIRLMLHQDIPLDSVMM